ncbi:Uncharacterised protein [Pantoea agglomerans]|nr:Uncharacterised protein [Pantoea agglomerans]
MAHGIINFNMVANMNILAIFIMVLWGMPLE